MLLIDDIAACLVLADSSSQVSLFSKRHMCPVSLTLDDEIFFLQDFLRDILTIALPKKTAPLLDVLVPPTWSKRLLR